jgi:hypothetical protein
MYGFDGTTPQRGSKDVPMTPMTDLSPNAVMNMLDCGTVGAKSRSKRASPADLNAADMLFRGLSSPPTAIAESPRASLVLTAAVSFLHLFPGVRFLVSVLWLVSLVCVCAFEPG